MNKYHFSFLIVFITTNISSAQPLELPLRGSSSEIILKMGSMDSVAFSPDEQTIAMGGPLGVFLWDAESYELIRWLAKDSGGASSMAFSPDGSRILTGGENATLWDVDSGEEIRTFLYTDDSWSIVAFSADGTKVLTEDPYFTEVWDAESGTLIQSFETSGWVRSVALSPDGSQVLIGGEELSEDMTSFFGVATLWDVESGDEIHSFRFGNYKTIVSVAFSPDGKRILLGTSDGGAYLRDAESGEVIRIFTGEAVAVAFSPDGNQVLLGGDRNCIVRLLNAENGHEIHRVFPSGRVRSVAFSPDGKRILTGGDGPVMLLDAESGEEIHTFYYTGNIESMMFSPNGEQVLTGNWMGGELWNAKTGVFLHSFSGRPAAFSPEGDHILTGKSHERDGAKLWDAKTGALVQTYRHDYPPLLPYFFVSLSLDGTRILTQVGSEVKLWNVKTGTEIQTFDTSVEIFGGGEVLFSPNGTHALGMNCFWGYCREAKLWDVEAWSIIKTFSGHAGPAEFSPDGDCFLTVITDNTALIRDTETGLVIQTMDGLIDVEDSNMLIAVSIVFSPDGSRVLTGSDRGSVQLWNVESGEEIHTFYGYTSPLAFSPDAKHIAIGTENGFVELWDTETMEWLRTFYVEIEEAAFSTGGGRLVTNGGSGVVRIWDISDAVGITGVRDFRLH